MPLLILLLTIALAVLWIVGEASNQPWLRRIAGPLFVIIIAGIAAVLSNLTTDQILLYLMAKSQRELLNPVTNVALPFPMPTKW